jgi:hypothetical protein
VGSDQTTARGERDLGSAQGVSGRVEAQPDDGNPDALLDLAHALRASLSKTREGRQSALGFEEAAGDAPRRAGRKVGPKGPHLLSHEREEGTVDGRRTLGRARAREPRGE